MGHAPLAGNAEAPAVHHAGKHARSLVAVEVETMEKMGASCKPAHGKKGALNGRRVA